MGLPRELTSQIALDVGKRELQVRPSCFKPARSRLELARRFVRAVRPLIGVAMAVVLAGCVTTSPVPSSPFLTAVAAAAAKASPSAMNANAAATDDVATSSTSRPANTPSPSQPDAEATKRFDRSRRRYAARLQARQTARRSIRRSFVHLEIWWNPSPPQGCGHRCRPRSGHHRRAGTPKAKQYRSVPLWLLRS